MPHTFDATLKDLVVHHPADFEALLNLHGPGPIAVLNVDLSVVSAATDVVLGYGDPPVELVDLNFQAGRDERLSDRVLLYNSLLRHRYHVPIHSLIVLLRPEADHPSLTGRITYQGQRRRGKMDFRYEVVRLWQIPARKLLSGGVGAMPLALLGKVPKDQAIMDGLAEVLRGIERRLSRKASSPEAAQLLTASFLLTGLRLDRGEMVHLFEGVQAVKESVGYQMILEEGELKALRETLLRQGREKFGAPSKATVAAINGLEDLGRLRRLIVRLLRVNSWDELLATR